MESIVADWALLPDGWTRRVRIDVADGVITTVTPDAGMPTHAIALAGMPNLHSHAFQRAMAGRAEVRGPGTDTFWTWRRIMYDLALAVTPDQMEAIAALAYMEMLEGGFTRVGEFHYLHHDPDGRPYADVAEMAARIAAAAGRTGIGLTMLPSFYANAGFGGVSPEPKQRRFINGLDGFARLFERCREIVARIDGATLGVAPHSLRAVTPDELSAVVAMCPEGPIHIHAAEQLREVEECVAWSGQRPVEWLLDHQGLDRRWCLIHATHMTPTETERFARTGAHAGLCPVTEANLGDGIFPGATFAGHGGRYGVGSDSNVLIGVAHELRQLEYAQRLGDRQRNVLANGAGSTGRAIYDAALSGGAVALGAPPARIAVGSPADLVTLRQSDLGVGEGDAVLDEWIFAGMATIDEVWVRGRRVVHGGRHVDRDAIVAGYRRVMRELIGS